MLQKRDLHGLAERLLPPDTGPGTSLFAKRLDRDQLATTRVHRSSVHRHPCWLNFLDFSPIFQPAWGSLRLQGPG